MAPAKPKSLPKTETIERVLHAEDLVHKGMMVKDAIIVAGISHSTYKDTRRFLKTQRCGA